jgi:hypothetical protein
MIGGIGRYEAVQEERERITRRLQDMMCERGRRDDCFDPRCQALREALAAILNLREDKK